MIPAYTHNLKDYLIALPDVLDSQDVLDVLDVITTDLADLYCHQWATFVQLTSLVTAKTKMPRKDIEKTLKQFLAQNASTNGHAPPRMDLPDTVAPEGIDEFLATHCTGTLSRAERDARFQLLIPALAVLQAMNPVALDGHVQQIAATLKFGIRAIKEELSHYVEEPQYADDPREELRLTADLTGMVNVVERGLLRLPGPTVYQRARMVCRIAPAGKPPLWLHRPPDAPIIVRLGPVPLRELSGQVTRCMGYDKGEKAWAEVIAPTMLFETLLSRVTWGFPALEGIVCAPTIRSDGVLITTPGFDAATGLYLDFGGIQFPTVPETPTEEEIRAAIDLLCKPFVNFSFKEPYHLSAVLAAILTLIARFAVAGNVPAFAIRSHAKGSGKGLLVNAIAMIGTGRTAPTWTQTPDAAEEGKRLLSIAIAGDACMHIDNVVYPLGSDKLDSALTTATIKDRLLGTNINQEAPWLTVVFASGNNMAFRGDMVRRVVPIDLDPKEERPEERSGFEHSPLLEWVEAERPRLMVAGLTILKGFFNAGCPKQDNIPEFGSFEPWANLIRHAVIWAGHPDPCAGRKTLEVESDTSYEALATLLQCWGACYLDTESHTLKEVIQDIERRKIWNPDAGTIPNDWNALHDALSTYDSKYDGKRLDTTRIGNALRNIEGRIVGTHRLIRKGESHRAAKWQRELIKKPTT